MDFSDYKVIEIRLKWALNGEFVILYDVIFLFRVTFIHESTITCFLYFVHLLPSCTHYIIRDYGPLGDPHWWFPWRLASSTTTVFYIQIVYTPRLNLHMQVPLGVLLLNKNKVDEMCKILDVLHKYVPTTTTEGETVPDGQVFSHEDYSLIQILLGGD